jgi:hypothetical protein
MKRCAFLLGSKEPRTGRPKGTDYPASDAFLAYLRFGVLLSPPPPKAKRPPMPI